MEVERIRIVIVDDHSKVHRGLAAVIDTFDDLELVGQASDGEQAIEVCRDVRPDVVIMDVIMPGTDGIDATRVITRENPEIKVLALSSFQDEESIRAMMAAGALGYLLKSSSIQDMATTIRTAHAGKLVFSPEVTRILMQPKDLGPSKAYGLTQREQEVLALMVEGLSNNEIADALTVSVSTSKFHVRSVLNKLDVSSRVEAVARALQERLA